MNENLKKLTEFLSAQDEETRKKACKMEVEEMIAFAAENGITVTAEDFAEAKEQAEKKKKASEDGELSDEELFAVAGGGNCYCPVVGGGAEDHFEIQGDDKYTNGGCACVAYGQGDRFDSKGKCATRCICEFYGEGSSDSMCVMTGIVQ